MPPTFSVITPVLNGEQFIRRSYSVLKLQSLTDWEWIVVDDGSTDATAESVQSLDDPRIKLISYPTNMGRGYARTEALKSATGAWMTVWDVDDLYFPDRLEKANEARLAGCDFCCSYAVLVDNNLGLTGFRGFQLDDTGTAQLFVHPSLSCRLEIARTIGYDPALRAGEDFEMIFRLASQYEGLWLQDALAIYQQVREINLQKAITSNESRLATYRKLDRTGNLHLGRFGFTRLQAKLKVKLLLLEAFRTLPSLYQRTVGFRTAGVIEPGWSLSEDRHAFLRWARERRGDNNWPL